MLKVTPIGSCRVANPLRRGAAAGGYRLETSGIYGYTHSAAEAVQQVRYLTGAFDPPDRLRPLIMPNSGPDHSGGDGLLADVYVVELSSAKTIRVGDAVIQLNYLSRHVPEVFSDRARGAAFWRLCRSEDADLRAERLAEMPAYRALDADRQALLRAIRLELASPARLAADIGWLMRTLPRVLFVTHVDARLPDGSPIPSRHAYIEMVSGVLRALGADFSDPTDAVDRYGQSRAMQSEGGSLTHYTPAFEEVLAAEWTERHLTAPRRMAV
ncbi:hypothetical protein [Oceanomicrobium pacificus]|uniref:Uncharacterized protein n=1 Tax=Oceanomicrobium pacificus TaxID=2692916 RepID=A0A6B0TYA7_9RHOB|nr:hypothetical protein [Oceanomicrobium pacificus]MXU65983.1 hypothetical protein [Oceanomicrobium pacificus]